MLAGDGSYGFPRDLHGYSPADVGGGVVTCSHH